MGGLVDSIKDGAEALNPLPSGDSVINGFTGVTGANAAREGSQLQYLSAQEAREQAERLNQPYLDLGASALPGFQQFVDDPSGASYLQNNPLFQQAVDYTGGQVKNQQALRGKLNSGGTIGQLFKNYLATGDQFVNSAYNRLLGPVTIGQNAANFQGTNSGNLITGGGDALAAGGIGAANSLSQGAGNVAGLLGTIGSLFFSDERLKEDIEYLGEDSDGNNVYEYSYKQPKDRYVGYMAQEVAEKDPKNVLLDPSGYLKVTERYKPQRIA